MNKREFYGIVWKLCYDSEKTKCVNHQGKQTKLNINNLHRIPNITVKCCICLLLTFKLS